MVLLFFFTKNKIRNLPHFTRETQKMCYTRLHYIDVLSGTKHKHTSRPFGFSTLICTLTPNFK